MHTLVIHDGRRERQSFKRGAQAQHRQLIVVKRNHITVVEPDVSVGKRRWHLDMVPPLGIISGLWGVNQKFILTYQEQVMYSIATKCYPQVLAQ
jgi:hypothetical protein